MKWVTPTDFKQNVQQIDLDALREKGIRLLLLDIDNTLVPTSVLHATPEIKRWLSKVKQAGFDVCLVSNNSRKRVDAFNHHLGYYTVHRATKPLRRGFLKAMRHHGVTAKQTCLVGDQLLTDVWGAYRMGIMCILVPPLSTDEGTGVRLKRRWERWVLAKIKPQRYGLIGNPVKHSLSPLLHDEVYRTYGLCATYQLFEPKAEQLAQTVEQLKQQDFSGFNITVPYKQAIVPLLDELSPEASALGTVNTVCIQNGKLIGHCTDGAGFVMQAKQHKVPIAGARIKIIGAGGAVPSLVYSLLQQGANHITLYNRTLSKAQNIAKQHPNVDALPLDQFSADDCSILINATSAGLTENRSPVPHLRGISSATTVFDLVYTPPLTAFLQQAKQHGCAVHNGYEMLIYQGLLADELWMGRKLNKKKLCKRILRRFEQQAKEK